MHRKSFVFGVFATLAFVTLLAAKPTNSCEWCMENESAMRVFCYSGTPEQIVNCAVEIQRERFERELVEDGFVRWNGNGAFYNIPK